MEWGWGGRNYEESLSETKKREKKTRCRSRFCPKVAEARSAGWQRHFALLLVLDRGGDRLMFNGLIALQTPTALPRLHPSRFGVGVRQTGTKLASHPKKLTPTTTVSLPPLQQGPSARPLCWRHPWQVMYPVRSH